MMSLHIYTAHILDLNNITTDVVSDSSEATAYILDLNSIVFITMPMAILIG